MFIVMIMVANKKTIQYSQIATKTIGEGGLSNVKMREYSCMKYGQFKATNRITDSLFTKIIQTPEIFNAINIDDELLISSAAYGSVPTASHAIMQGIVDRFAMKGLNVRTFKIEREGSFHQANYGSLDIVSRQHSLNSRQVYISDEVKNLISNKTILIVDDLRATGSHEASLINLLSKHTSIHKLLFAYPIAFDTNFGRLSPSFESVLNDAQIKNIDDLLALSRNSEYPLIINARLIKFILFHGAVDKNRMKKLLNSFSYDYCLALYSAAISSDGYFAFAEYKSGFEMLKTYLRDFKKVGF